MRTPDRPIASLNYLERYRDIAPDFDALVGTARDPLPRVVWANPLLSSGLCLEHVVSRRCEGAKKIAWLPHAWKIPAATSPGNWPEYRAGLLHAQEEASIWPGDLVGAQPGETILDLCAAPGSKTLRIAAAMNNEGLIVANERKWGRLSPLRHNVSRMGVTCALTICGDGNRLPRELGPFDRSLADVPCSCEGTGRKNGGRVRPTTEEERSHLSDLQVGLLRNAIARTKRGGVIVYATCTYAPEENEGVLDRIDPETVRIEEIVPPEGWRTSPGIDRWQGKSYRPEVTRAHRVWPEQNDSGGFFVAKLRRL